MHIHSATRTVLATVLGFEPKFPNSKSGVLPFRRYGNKLVVEGGLESECRITPTPTL